MDRYLLPGDLPIPTTVAADLLQRLTKCPVEPTHITAWQRAGLLPEALAVKGEGPKGRLAMPLGALMDAIDNGILPPPEWRKMYEKRAAKSDQPAQSTQG